MIPTNKLKKLVLESLTKLIESDFDENIDIWDYCCKEIYNLTESRPDTQELKDLFFKEIQPEIIYNNFGYDDEIIAKLRLLKKGNEESRKMNITGNDATEVLDFSRLGDPLQAEVLSQTDEDVEKILSKYVIVPNKSNEESSIESEELHSFRDSQFSQFSPISGKDPLERSIEENEEVPRESTKRKSNENMNDQKDDDLNISVAKKSRQSMDAFSYSENDESKISIGPLIESLDKNFSCGYVESEVAEAQQLAQTPTKNQEILSESPQNMQETSNNSNSSIQIAISEVDKIALIQNQIDAAKDAYIMEIEKILSENYEYRYKLKIPFLICGNFLQISDNEASSHELSAQVTENEACSTVITNNMPNDTETTVSVTSQETENEACSTTITNNMPNDTETTVSDTSEVTENEACSTMITNNMLNDTKTTVSVTSEITENEACSTLITNNMPNDTKTTVSDTSESTENLTQIARNETILNESPSIPEVNENLLQSIENLPESTENSQNKLPKKTKNPKFAKKYSTKFLYTRLSDVTVDEELELELELDMNQNKVQKFGTKDNVISSVTKNRYNQQMSEIDQVISILSSSNSQSSIHELDVEKKSPEPIIPSKSLEQINSEKGQDSRLKALAFNVDFSDPTTEQVIKCVENDNNEEIDFQKELNEVEVASSDEEEMAEDKCGEKKDDNEEVDFQKELNQVEIASSDEEEMAEDTNKNSSKLKNRRISKIAFSPKDTIILDSDESDEEHGSTANTNESQLNRNSSRAQLSILLNVNKGEQTTGKDREAILAELQEKLDRYTVDDIDEINKFLDSIPEYRCSLKLPCFDPDFEMASSDEEV